MPEDAADLGHLVVRPPALRRVDRTEPVDPAVPELESVPLPDATVDVVISNCVINLAPDKSRVFAEAFRVLKPGAKLAVSDIVTDGPLPDPIKKSLSAWAGCVADRDPGKA